MSGLRITNRDAAWSCIVMLGLLLGCLATQAGAQNTPGASKLRKSAEDERSEPMYNGIRLAEEWPPKDRVLNREPQPVPYLEDPPDVIPIDVGRQMFVDDFLIEETDLRRTFHNARFHPASPVVTGDQPLEFNGDSFFAAPFSDGVWHDPLARKFKMWMLEGPLTFTCYAESNDGIRWTKPELDVVKPGTNIVLESKRDSATVWFRPDEPDLEKRYALVKTESVDGWRLALYYSSDGIAWGERQALSEKVYDRTTIFYNPFREVWVLSIRDMHGGKRTRKYHEAATLEEALAFDSEDPVLWLEADRLDPHHPNPEYASIEPQLYNFDAVAYESLMVGLYSIWQGPENDVSRRLGNHKRCDLLLGFSRDGFHFARPSRERFIACNETEGAWNWGNIQSAGGGCVIVGDLLYFYTSGRALDPTGRQGNMSTGLAMLRRDGFASIDAAGTSGTLTTRPVTFHGKRLFVNADAARGALSVEVLDAEGQPIEPFTLDKCTPIGRDATLLPVRWGGECNLSEIAGKPVRFRFHLSDARLFAFWVSPDSSGASQGYVAAGGPGYTTDRDTVGTAAYATAAMLAESWE